jgi:hypothetical protein
MKSTVLFYALVASLAFTHASQAGSLDASSEASTKMSKEFAGVISEAGQSSWNTMGDLMNGSSNVATGAYQGTKNVVLKSWNWSGDAFTAVFQWSKDASGNVAEFVVKGTKSAVKFAGNSSTASAEMTKKWVIKPITKGVAVLTNGSQQVWVASSDVLQRLKENSVETDLTNYSN